MIRAPSETGATSPSKSMAVCSAVHRGLSPILDLNTTGGAGNSPALFPSETPCQTEPTR